MVSAWRCPSNKKAPSGSSPVSYKHTLLSVVAFLPASAARCVRPLLGGEGAGEGEPTSVHRSPAREVEEAMGEKGRVKIRGENREGRQKRPKSEVKLGLSTSKSDPPYQRSVGIPEQRSYQEWTPCKHRLP